MAWLEADGSGEMAVSGFDPAQFLVDHRLIEAQELSIEPLAGGYLNQVYRVRGAQIDWVVKRFRLSSELGLFPNLPAAEAMALERLAAIGAAPSPIAFVGGDTIAPVLVYQFYAGEPWNGGVAQVSHLLRRVAQIQPTGFRAVPMTPGGIAEQGDAFAAVCEADMRRRLAAARPVTIDIGPGPRRLIHTDFGPGNLIVGKEGLKAIDWQCPAAGDPAEDLAAFLSPAFQILYGRPPLTIGEERALIAAYDDEATIARLHLLRPFFDWRMASYCAMRRDYYAETRPNFSARYALATAALLARLGEKT